MPGRKLTAEENRAAQRQREQNAREEHEGDRHKLEEAVREADRALLHDNSLRSDTVDKIADLIDAKLRLATHKLGLDPNDLW